MYKLHLIFITSFLFLITPLLAQTQLGETLSAPSGGGFFGSSVALSKDGKILVAGAPTANRNGKRLGSVNSYQLIEGRWVQLGQTIWGDQHKDQAGHSLAISGAGSRIAVGAITNNGQTEYCGQVKVHTLIQNKWEQLGQTIYGEKELDFWGRTVVLSKDGSTMAVSSSTTKDKGNHTGKLKVYRLINNNWQQIGNTFIGKTAGERLGTSASLSDDGNILAIGIPGSSLLRKGYGTASVFSFDGDKWRKMGTDLQGLNAGNAVSLSADGQTLAIANFGNGRPYHPPRQAKIFIFKGQNWEQIGNNILNAGAPLALSSDGKTLAARTYKFDWKTEEQEGQIGKFKLIQNEWQLVGKYIDGAGPLHQLGWSIAISADGNLVASGARSANKSKGVVKVFQW